MKEIWTVISWTDEYIVMGENEMIFIGDPEEVRNFCEEYTKEKGLIYQIKESFEVE